MASLRLGGNLRCVPSLDSEEALNALMYSYVAIADRPAFCFGWMPRLRWLHARESYRPSPTRQLESKSAEVKCPPRAKLKTTTEEFTTDF